MQPPANPDSDGVAPICNRSRGAARHPPGCPAPRLLPRWPSMSTLPSSSIVTDARAKPSRAEQTHHRRMIFSAWLDAARALDWSQGNQARIEAFSALQQAFRTASEI